MAIESSKILGLLSNLYLCKPTREAVESWKALLSEDVPDPLLKLTEVLDELDLHSEQEFEELLWEYTRLFIGPYRLPCPPWESVYASPKKLMMQEAYGEVKDFYNETGLTINDPNIMPDHIGAELNFLAVLYKKMNTDAGRESYYVDRAKRFMDEHLMRWILQFTLDMEEAAQLTLYKALAQITRDFITNECNHVR